MDLVTVAILTKNEERHMVDVVRNAKKLTNSVLVIDCGSTDKTVELAEQEGAKVVFRAWDDDFSAQRNFAIGKVVTDYILFLDADERMDDILIKNIKKSVADDQCKFQYKFIEEVSAFGFHYKHGVFGPSKIVRLFPTKNVKYVNKVHERPECNLPKKNLDGTVLHYTYRDYQHWLTKAGQYTTIWADYKYKDGKRVNVASPLGHCIFGFIRAYIFQLGFLDGWAGIYSSVQHSLYTWLKYIKLYEKQKSN